MSSKTRDPGADDTAPIESRRTPATADIGGVTADPNGTEEGEDSVLDAPDFGTFSAESARPSPLDDIAEVERRKAPRD